MRSSNASIATITLPPTLHSTSVITSGLASGKMLCSSWWSAPDACSMGGGVDPVEFSGGELTVVPELDADPWRSGSLIILC